MIRRTLQRGAVSVSLCLLACGPTANDAGEGSTGAEQADTSDAVTSMDAPGSDSGGEGTPMSFFVSSVGGGAGGDLGGLEGADALCQELADAVGSGDLVWRAFLSTDGVDARARIGNGPWYTAEGRLLAADLDALFVDGVSPDTDNDGPNQVEADAKRLLLLDEQGMPVSSDPLEHDILTGSDPDGNRIAGQNCENWTSDSDDVAGQVGHSDSRGPQGDNPAFGWVSAHGSAGCSIPGLRMGGSSGRVYCFAQR